MSKLSFHPKLSSIAAAIATAILPITFASVAAAQTSITIYSSARPGTLSPSTFRSGGEYGAVPGYAVVRQTQSFDLARGRSVIRFSDVPALIDPTTVSFESLTDTTGTRVVEQNFEFDLTSTRKLLEKYLDREVTVEQVRGQSTESVTGTLLSARDGIVLRLADGSLRTLANYSGVRLASLPGGLISKPTLVWDIAAERAGTHKARVGYQTQGITWWTDYNLTLNEDGGSCKLDVGAWVTVVNQTGAGFTDAKLKLVAGDVQRAQPQPAADMAMASAPRVMAKAEVAGFEEKAFFEYHLYTLGRPTTIANNSTKQIELFPAARGAQCEKTLVYAGQAGMFGGYFGGPMTDRNFGNQSNKKVDVFLRFRNRDNNQLGIPLPAGKVRVSKLDTADQSLEFIGEDIIDHTPKNETIQIRLGSAFDVVGERTQVDYRMDSKARWIEEDIEIKVRNQKDVPTTVIVKETPYRWSNWTIKSKSADFEKIDARTVHFPVKIAKGAEAIIRYTVRYTW
ncbi:MAG: DUF4139 domain-containing protein [Burkholderiales bacterium]|jgi:hypothetical protein|nr:hypothetical protein [Nitrosomonadaceae bacterium]